jgi:PAS domain S-box-containing protein
MDIEITDLYRTLVETSADGIWVIDLEGRTLYANPEVARIHGVPVESLGGLTVFDTLDEAGAEQFAAHLEQVRQGRTNEAEVEVQWVRNDGSTTWTLCRETPLLDAEGRPEALLHRHTPYDERRAILESLREHQEALADEIRQNHLLQAVASAANEATTMTEVLRHARDMVLLHDDWERARAFVPDGHSLTAFRLPDAAEEDDPQRLEVELALAERAAASHDLEWDERKLTLAFPVLLGDEVYAVIVITSAPPLWRFELIETMARQVAQQLARVAERERAQRNLAQARDEAMEASRLKSEFLATMSHEIRTPLNGVIGLSELLQRTDLDGEQARLAEGLQVAGRALLALIDDILDFSKIEAGHLHLESVPFEVRSLVEEVVSVQVETARKKGVGLTVSCADDLPASLSGDPTRLSQVITNLVANAVKFTDHGSVTVSVTAAPEHDEVRLRVEVRDTGPGVDPDRLAALFDPFTQADSSTTRLYGGTGLGLAISSELVAAMGGEIGYQPNPGGGSVFAFTAALRPTTGLSLAHVPLPLPEDELGADGDRPSLGTVLVVEDNPVNQLVAAGLLAALGYESVMADNGAAGVEAAAQGGFTAILMDVQMPVLDGYAATRAIREAEVGSRVPIIAMTAAAVEGVRERCLEAGMDTYLTKPVDPSRLGATLEALRRRSGEATGLARLDMARLEELRELDGGVGAESFVVRAIGNLVAGARSDLDALDRAAVEGDADLLCSVAHRLAGSALNLGATHGGEVARELEHAVLSGVPLAEAVQGLPQVRQAVTQDLEALAAYRDRLLSMAS